MLLRWCLGFFVAIVAIEAIAQVPTIQYFSPKSTTVDEIVEIIGTNFGTNKESLKVYFGSSEGLVQKVTETKIHVMVPPGSVYGKITVINTSTGLSVKSSDSFLMSFGGEGISLSSFVAQVDFPGDLGLYHHCIADFDLDGKMDAAMVNLQTNNVSVFRNQSTLSTVDFAPKLNIDIGVPSTNVVSGDLDGDGKLDLITSQYPTTDGFANKIFVLRNTSITTTGEEEISFASHKEIIVDGNNAKNVVVYDLDGDGKPELLVSNEANNVISILKNESTVGNIKFNTEIRKVLINNVKQCSGLALGDLNGDGKPEIVVTAYLGSNIYIFSNVSATGSIDFAPQKIVYVSGNIINVAIGDLNEDNKQDIVVTKILSGNISVVLNKTETLGGEIIMSDAPKDFITAPQPWGIDIGDLDGDGKPDLAIASVFDGKLLTVLRNTSENGVLSFASKMDIKTLEPSRSVKIADINGDGKPDITFTSINTAKLSILRNKHCILPKLAPSGPITLCSGQKVLLKTGKGRGISYQWKKNNVDITTATGSSLEVSSSEAAEYHVVVNGESNSCSNASNKVAVATSGGLIPVVNSISNDGPVCEGSEVTLKATATGGATFSWSGPNGFTSSAQNPVIPNFQSSMVGNYILKVKVGDCISEPDTTIVLLNTSSAVANIIANSTVICDGGSVELKVSEGSGNSYKWKKDGSFITGANYPAYKVFESGDYAVEVSTLSGCKVVSKEVNIKKLEKVVAGFTMPSSGCTNTPIHLINTTTDTEEGISVTYSWTFGNGSSSSQRNPSANNVIYSNKGSYTVKLKVTVEGTCVSEMQKSIVISDVFTVDIQSSSPNNNFCNGEGVTLTAPEGYSLYKWRKNSAEIIAESTTSHIRVNEAGNYSVEVTQEGCMGGGTIVLTENIKPDVVASITGIASVVVPGDSVELFATGAESYEWFPASGLNNAFISNPKAAPLNNTVYSVVGKNSSGCSDTSSVEVLVTNDLLVTPYNIVTPNGDQKNDTWKIQGIEKYPDCKIIIINRQGQKVFEAQPYVNNWDGTLKGKKLPEGAYFYLIQCLESGKGKTGNLTLVR